MELSDREERAVARLAQKARLDTIDGGASALVLAQRADHMGWHSCGRSALEVVSIVYSASTGRHHTDLEAWECPECGNACLGMDAAMACCQVREFEAVED